MSFLTTSRVNDFEIGARRQEVRSLRQEIIEVTRQDLRPSERERKLKELRESLSECSGEYQDLCNNVRRNFI